MTKKKHFFIILMTCSWIYASYGHVNYIIRFLGCFYITKKQWKSFASTFPLFFGLNSCYTAYFKKLFLKVKNEICCVGWIQVKKIGGKCLQMTSIASLWCKTSKESNDIIYVTIRWLYVATYQENEEKLDFWKKIPQWLPYNTTRISCMASFWK